MNLKKTAIIALFIIPGALFSFTNRTHQNMPEDAFLFMEDHSSNQQRWVTDYLKAKAGGRYNEGSCMDSNAGSDDPDGNPIECGAIGIVRTGGFAPDFWKDNFWDDFTKFDWHFANPFYKNNFTSWNHFINLLKTADGGHPLKTNNYNDYDGYSWQSNYGFPDAGIDYGVAAYMNNAQMSIDLPNCTHSKCSEKVTLVPNANPAVDYKQNGSTTPVGSPSGNMKVAAGDGSNYNCFADTAIVGSCPDRGSKISGGSHYQIPNSNPGRGSYFKGNEDWMIYEPADNVATFYYNEWFMEGGASRNTQLDPDAALGRYYSSTGVDMQFLAVTLHYAGDMNQQSHIWSTIGYNHSEYETYTDKYYGMRVAGGNNPDVNFENMKDAGAYLAHRLHRWDSSLEAIFMEQAFLTYHNRLRSDYDTLTDTREGTRKNAATWAINNSIAMMSIILEKGVLDLRKYRQ